MIISELKKTSTGRTIGTQKCEVICDKCSKAFVQVFSNRSQTFSRYTKDLCRSCRQRLQYSDGLRETQRASLIKSNRSQKGKTAEEILGVEGAIKKKLKNSVASSGKNNPNYGGKYSRWDGAREFNKAKKGRSNSEIYGEEKAEKIRKLMSAAFAGENNPMFGKPSPQGSGNGWSGWYKGFFFRSILELSYLKMMFDQWIKIESSEADKFRIPYVIDGIKRNYFPDYYLPESKTFIEIKPSNLLKSESNEAKFKAAKLLHGDNFKVLTENDFSKLTTEEISELRATGVIKFTNRYESKFKEKYEN